MWSGGLFLLFLAPGPMLFLNMEEWKMDRKELAYAKQALFGVKDWDAFQAVIRHWSRMMKPDDRANWTIRVKKS